MRRRLPNITGILARGAELIGAFGLVRVTITILYHAPFWVRPLAPSPLPRRGLRRGTTHSGWDYVLCWVIMTDMMLRSQALV